VETTSPLIGRAILCWQRLVRYRDMRLGKDVSASEGGDGLSFGEVRRRFHFKGFGARHPPPVHVARVHGTTRVRVRARPDVCACDLATTHLRDSPTHPRTHTPTRPRADGRAHAVYAVGRYLYKVVSATRASSVLAARLSAARNSSRHSTGRHSAGRASAGRASTARDAQSRVSATRDAQSRVSAPDERTEPGKLSSATSMTSPLGLAEIREDGEPADAERSTPASGQVDRA
jgi:hypothetical protein